MSTRLLPDSEGGRRTGKARFPLYGRVFTRRPERNGRPCRIVTRGTRNTVLVEFDDGYRVVTSGNYLRRR